MGSTPSHRLRLTPANSPFLPRPARSPHRGRPLQIYDSRLSLKRVIGTTCTSPTGFDAVQSSFAYIAGGAVVVVDVNGDSYGQRFFRARPTATLYTTPSLPILHHHHPPRKRMIAEIESHYETLPSVQTSGQSPPPPRHGPVESASRLQHASP